MTFTDDDLKQAKEGHAVHGEHLEALLARMKAAELALKHRKAWPYDYKGNRERFNKWLKACGK